MKSDFGNGEYHAQRIRVAKSVCEFDEFLSERVNDFSRHLQPRKNFGTSRPLSHSRPRIPLLEATNKLSFYRTVADKSFFSPLTILAESFYLLGYQFIVLTHPR